DRVWRRFMRARVCRLFGIEATRLDCLPGLRALDRGGGGGLWSEPLAGLGAAVVGADPAADNVEVARRHAAESGVAVDYRATTAEALARAGERFDLVLGMAVVEHVAHLPAFSASCSA